MNSPFNRVIRQQLISLLSICLFIQIIISLPLWLSSERVYPFLSLFEAFPVEFGYAIRAILLTGFMLCLLIFALGYHSRIIITFFFSCLFLLIAEDINRLQVWVYQSAFFLFLMFYPLKRQDNYFIKTLQIGMAGIYWWSGLQKLNIYFVEDIFPWMMEPLGMMQIAEKYPFLAIVVAIFEALLGLGLLFPKSRKVTAVLAMIFHLIILFILSPFGHQWNTVVWPWNLCMIGLVYLLFYINSKPVFSGLYTELKKYPVKGFALLIFVMFPALNFYQLWDEQMSFKMYSGHSPEGVFYFQGQEQKCFPEQFYEELIHFEYSSQTKRIIFDDWAFAILKVAPYKSRYRIVQAAKKLCECVEKTELAGLEILEVRRWHKNKDEFVVIPCSELLHKKYERLEKYFTK